jgi:alkanesulfonate monooxygenase SsuD/methylene tetrahydromethanopterin reductase-like flavin-dependent oxidoreductase (luciferase family)
MARIGIAFSGGPNASEIVDCVRLAESLGYESAWVAEGHGGDQFAVLSACAVKTSRILLGTSISSVFVRTVPTIAMAAASVDELSAGRFILGLGSSHKVQVEPEHGVTYGKPLTRVRETVEAIRALLRDGEVSFHGETVQIEHFDLWFRPRRAEIPIYLAAVFPKMIRACGEIAQGVILTRSSLKTGTEVRAHLSEGARAAGAWSRGDRRAALAAVSDAMVDATSIAGTPEDCRRQLQAYRDSGIDVPIISPFARGSDAKAKFEAAIRACAPH